MDALSVFGAARRRARSSKRMLTWWSELTAATRSWLTPSGHLDTPCGLLVHALTTRIGAVGRQFPILRFSGARVLPADCFLRPMDLSVFSVDGTTPLPLQRTVPRRATAE